MILCSILNSIPYRKHLRCDTSFVLFRFFLLVIYPEEEKCYPSTKPKLFRKLMWLMWLMLTQYFMAYNRSWKKGFAFKETTYDLGCFWLQVTENPLVSILKRMPHFMYLKILELVLVSDTDGSVTLPWSQLTSAALLSRTNFILLLYSYTPSYSHPTGRDSASQNLVRFFFFN